MTNGRTGVEDGIVVARVNSVIQCTMCTQSCACTDARSTQMRVSDALRGSVGVTDWYAGDTDQGMV